MWRENRTIDDCPLCHGNHWILYDTPALWTHAGVPEEETENA